jgi:hypothetical protein
MNLGVVAINRDHIVGSQAGHEIQFGSRREPLP